MNSYIRKLIVVFTCYRSLKPYVKFMLTRLTKKRKRENDNKVVQKNSSDEIYLEFLKGRKLLNNQKGYWSLDPMIELKKLNEYYQNEYWNSFKKGIYHNVNNRDIDHFNLISKYVKGFSKTKKTILNFGSGHLGSSFLFYFSGHRVINFDLQPAKTNLVLESDNWININSLSNLNHKVDLLYSSHSLEHVQSLDDFEKDFFNIVKAKGYVFFEVPNENELDVKIDFPHTYYFRKEYFKNLPFLEILCDVFSHDKFPNIPKDNGDVIRYIGRKKL